MALLLAKRAAVGCEWYIKQEKKLALLVSEVSVFSQNIGCQIVVLVLAIQQEEVAKSLGWEWVLLQEELKFLEAVRRFDLSELHTLDSLLLRHKYMANV